MKRILLSFCLIFSFIPTYTQVVVSNPAFITEDGTIEITYDATQGNKGMVGAMDCYAHTGLITSKSSSFSDWKYAPTWLDNNAKYKMTSVGTDKWKLTISPDIRTYYGVTDANEFIYKLAFVFRNSTGTLQGKDVGNADIMVDVYPKGLQVAFDQPANNSIVDPASTLTVSARSSQSASLNLYLNTVSSNPIAQSTGTTRVSYSGTFVAGNYFLIAEAQSNGTIVRDTTYFCSTAKGTRSSEVRPTGLKEGITYNAEGSVTFCIYAPKKEYFYLLGDFNDFHPDNNYLMKYQETGNIFAKKRYFWLTLTGLDPNKEYAFQYLADGSIRIGDPYCEKILDPWNDKYIGSTVYPDLRQYPSAKAQDVVSTFKINQDKYQWKSTGFHVPAQNNLMIYELNFRDFTNEGTVNAAIQKLDYLQALGVNAIEMMPITEFDGNDSWGYNPNFYFAPDKAYGTKQDYQHFIDECHTRGIAVIQDVVFNHSWGLNPWCKLWWDAVNSRPAADNPYYNPVAPHQSNFFGNDFNHTSVLTRNFFKRALGFWLSEYKVDGFRFDFTKGFTQTVSTSDAAASSYDQSRIDNLKVYVDTIKSSNPNAYVIFEHFCNTDEEDVLAAYKNTMLWRNQNWAYQQAAKGSSNGDFTNMAGTNRLGYPESHDEERLAYALFSGGLPALQDTASAMSQLAACAAFAYLNPGPRMMWQFGELGYDYSINYNSRTGRKPVRWDYLDNPLRKGLHDTYAKVLNFRKKYADLFANPTSWNWQVSTSDWNNGRRIYLTNGTLTAVILANFTAIGSVTAYPAFGKTGTWYDLISGETLNVTDPNISLTLPAFGLKIYTDVLINSVSETKASSVEVYPNPVTDYLFIKGKRAAGIELYSTSGVKVYQNMVSGQSVNLSKLPAGIYISRIGFEDGSFTECKVCKQ